MSRKILGRRVLIQTPLPGEVKRAVEITLLGPSNSGRTRLDPEGEVPVVNLVIMEEELGEFQDEQGSITVPLAALRDALEPA